MKNKKKKYKITYKSNPRAKAKTTIFRATDASFASEMRKKIGFGIIKYVRRIK